MRNMSSVAIVGAQWGDEGKGKVVDIYTESADLVVRYAGGPNAGHTLVVGKEKVVVRLLPSGILRSDTACLLGQGMVIDLGVLLGEIDELQRRGHKDIEQRLRISDRAHLILPYHISVDELREAHALGDRAIGTTKKGIGPAYEDKARRTGIRTGDLREPERLREKIEAALLAWSPTLAALGGTVPEVSSVLSGLLERADRILPLLTNASRQVDDALRSKQRVLFEGAQGTLLDIDHGTYPFVTSSSAVAGGAAIGTGVGPNRIRSVVGITKAYATRVGAGPFPTELGDEDGKHLRELGAEFGSVTGRPRRTGWLDLAALRYAARVSGMDGLAITKLDVLTGMERVKLCVAYETARGKTDDFPIDAIEAGALAQPLYQTFAGWREPIGAARRLQDLPAAARKYLDFIAEQCQIPLYLVSVGPGRDETIVLVNPLS